MATNACAPRCSIHLIAIYICWLGVFTLAGARVSGEPLADGFYSIVDEGEGVQVARSYGGNIWLGENLSGEFGEVSIWSIANDNSRWRVWLQRVPKFDTIGRVAFYCDGVCEVVSSHSDPDDTHTMELIVDVYGQKLGEQLATRLDTELRERLHPGHQITCRWKPVERTYALGETVILQLEIENAGDAPLRFIEGGQQRGARDNQFRFLCRATSGYGDSVPDTGDPQNFGGKGGYREIKPGEVFQKEVDISKWFRFEKSGTYRITGLYEIQIYDEQFDNVLWDDFAVGQCLVTIEPAQKD